jgi:hypothetical protein
MRLLILLAAGGLAGSVPAVRPPSSPAHDGALCQDLLILERLQRWTVDSVRALVRGADAIVLARAVAEAPAVGLAARDSALVAGARPKRHWWSKARSGAVAFRVVEVLAAPVGETALRPGGQLALAGVLTRADHYSDRDEYYHRAPVPRLEGRGAEICEVALGYRVGREYLLLLGREPATGRYTPYLRQWDPSNERVRGPDDPWLQWVRAELRAATGR